MKVFRKEGTEMCFRPTQARKRKEIACPKCAKMNPLPISIESSISELLRNESAKAILERHCSILMSDSRLKMAMGMTLKQVIPMSQGKVTIAMVELVARELAELPQDNKCQFCGESLPQSPGAVGAAPKAPPSSSQASPASPTSPIPDKDKKE